MLHVLNRGPKHAGAVADSRQNCDVVVPTPDLYSTLATKAAERQPRGFGR